MRIDIEILEAIKKELLEDVKFYKGSEDVIYPLCYYAGISLDRDDYMAFREYLEENTKGNNRYDSSGSLVNYNDTGTYLWNPTDYKVRLEWLDEHIELNQPK